MPSHQERVQRAGPPPPFGECPPVSFDHRLHWVSSPALQSVSLVCLDCQRRHTVSITEWERRQADRAALVTELRAALGACWRVGGR